MFINFVNVSKTNIIKKCKECNIRYAGILLYKLRIENDEDINNRVVSSLVSDGIIELSNRTRDFALFTFTDSKIEYKKLFFGNYLEQYYKKSDAETLDLIMEWLGVVFGVGGKYPSFIVLDVIEKNYKVFDLTKKNSNEIFSFLGYIYSELGQLSVEEGKSPDEVLTKLGLKKVKSLPNTNTKKLTQREILKEIIKDSGLTQEQLADKLDLSYVQVNRYFNGKTTLMYKRDTVISICIACNATKSITNWALREFKCGEIDFEEDKKWLSQLRSEKLID